MSIDLSPVAGLPLLLDPDALGVETDGGLRLERQARTAGQMEAVLLEPHALPPEQEVYWICRVREAAGEPGLLERMRLAYACVLVPPQPIGAEFAKTQGHYHPAMPGGRMAYPEVYTHFYGRLYLLMQRRVNGAAGQLDDCVLIDLQPGQSVMVPPGYAHILINPSDGPALMAGLYCPDFVSDYQPIRQLAGAAYYLVDGDEGEQIVRNPRYSEPPPLQRLTDVAGTRFAPPDEGRPLWASLWHDPERYRILTETQAAQRYFPPEDQQR